MPGASLRVDGLFKTYGRTVAIDHVSFETQPGELLAILGPSGSGKTSVLMTIAGFEAPTRGTVHIDGRDVTRLHPNRRGLGVVFQSYTLFPHMTVAENIAFPLRMRRMAKTAVATHVDAALALVQLSGYGDRLPSQLSGGQQQRIAIARAVVFSPPALLMDEPLGALDRRLREDMQVEIKRLHRQLGMTMLYVTHDQEEALSLADRVAVMRAGRIEQIGTPRELYNSPANEFVADFLGQMNFLDGTVIADHTIKLDVGAIIESVVTLPPTGTPVRIGIRPESVRLDTSGPIQGMVVAESYAGGTQIVHVELQPGTLRARIPVERGTVPRQVGDMIAASWSSSDLHIFTSSGNTDVPRPL